LFGRGFDSRQLHFLEELRARLWRARSFPETLEKERYTRIGYSELFPLSLPP